MTALNITNAGAGSIGCFVGGVLAHSGHAVCFLGRVWDDLIKAAKVAGDGPPGLTVEDIRES